MYHQVDKLTTILTLMILPSALFCDIKIVSLAYLMAMLLLSLARFIFILLQLFFTNVTVTQYYRLNQYDRS